MSRRFSSSACILCTSTGVWLHWYLVDKIERVVRTLKLRVGVSPKQLVCVISGISNSGDQRHSKANVPLESSITTFSVISDSSNFPTCPGPEPRSRIVLNFRLISCSYMRSRTKRRRESTSPYHESFYQSIGDFVTNIINSSTPFAVIS